METVKLDKKDEFGRYWRITEEDGFYHVYLNGTRRASHTHLSVSTRYVNLLSDETPRSIYMLDNMLPSKDGED